MQPLEEKVDLQKSIKLMQHVEEKIDEEESMQQMQPLEEETEEEEESGEEEVEETEEEEVEESDEEEVEESDEEEGIINMSESNLHGLTPLKEKMFKALKEQFKIANNRIGMIEMRLKSLEDRVKEQQNSREEVDGEVVEKADKDENIINVLESNIHGFTDLNVKMFEAIKEIFKMFDSKIDRINMRLKSVEDYMKEQENSSNEMDGTSQDESDDDVLSEMDKEDADMDEAKNKADKTSEEGGGGVEGKLIEGSRKRKTNFDHNI